MRYSNPAYLTQLTVTTLMATSLITITLTGCQTSSPIRPQAIDSVVNLPELNQRLLKDDSIQSFFRVPVRHRPVDRRKAEFATYCPPVHCPGGGSR